MKKTLPRLEHAPHFLVEKRDHLAVHGLFDSRKSGERFLQNVVPEYVSKGYYMDKTLRASDFEIIEKLT